MASLTSSHPGSCLFEATVSKDYDAIIKLFATNGRNSLVSYLSMKSRWAQQQEAYSKSGRTLFSFFLSCIDFHGYLISPRVFSRKLINWNILTYNSFSYI